MGKCVTASTTTTSILHKATKRKKLEKNENILYEWYYICTSCVCRFFPSLWCLKNICLFVFWIFKGKNEWQWEWELLCVFNWPCKVHNTFFFHTMFRFKFVDCVSLFLLMAKLFAKCFFFSFFVFQMLDLYSGMLISCSWCY